MIGIRASITIESVADQHRHTPRIATVTHSLSLLQRRPDRRRRSHTRRFVHGLYRRRQHPCVGQNDRADMRDTEQNPRGSTAMGQHTSIGLRPKQVPAHPLTRSRKCINTETPIQTEWDEIQPEATCRYLGLTMDAKLHTQKRSDRRRRRNSLRSVAWEGLIWASTSPTCGESTKAPCSLPCPCACRPDSRDARF